MPDSETTPPAETQTEDDWISVRKAAEILDVHVQTIRRMCESGVLTYRKRTPRRTEVRRGEITARLEPRGLA